MSASYGESSFSKKLKDSIKIYNLITNKDKLTAEEMMALTSDLMDNGVSSYIL